MPIILIFLSAIILYNMSRKVGIPWRESILSACVKMGTLMFFITEILSLFKAITFFGVIASWVLVTVGLIAYLASMKYQNKHFISDDLISRFKQFEKLSILDRYLIASVIFIAIVVGFTALAFPPNNWDSMSYHMARVAHWIQNQNVDHYPTNYTPQLYQNPWSEFFIMHFQILSGSDRFANLVQWFSMVGSLIAVSLIAEQLGANSRGQVFSVVVCATIPMGILQASSTQNDYVLSFWILCLIYYGLSRFSGVFSIRANLFYLASSLGLAILTKGTSYVYVLPFLIWFFALEIKRFGWSAFRSAIVGMIIVLLINLRHYIRNFTLFGSAIGGSETASYKNTVFSIPHYASNISKNLALMLSTPIRSINLLIINAVKPFHRLIGIDINDAQISMMNFDLPSTVNHEDFATSPLFLLLIFGSIIWFLISWRDLDEKKYRLRSYLFCVVSMFLLFVLLITWQMFHLRLHLPILICFSPFIGVALVHSRFKAAKLIVSALVLSSFFWIFFNETRPLIANSEVFRARRVENLFTTNRTQQYFTNNKDLARSYSKSVDLVLSQKCDRVGLSLKDLPPTAPFEYPLWVLFHEKNSSIYFQAVDVENASAKKYENASSNDLCAIISNDPTGNSVVTIASKPYYRAWFDERIKVFFSRSVN